jgi:hypothetical protein
MLGNSLLSDDFFLPDEAAVNANTELLNPNSDPLISRSRKSSLSAVWSDIAPGKAGPFGPSLQSSLSNNIESKNESTLSENDKKYHDIDWNRRRKTSNLSPANHMWNDARHINQSRTNGGRSTNGLVKSEVGIAKRRKLSKEDVKPSDLPPLKSTKSNTESHEFSLPVDPTSFFASIFDENDASSPTHAPDQSFKSSPTVCSHPGLKLEPSTGLESRGSGSSNVVQNILSQLPLNVQDLLMEMPVIAPMKPIPKKSPPIILTLVDSIPVYLCIFTLSEESFLLDNLDDEDMVLKTWLKSPLSGSLPLKARERRGSRSKTAKSIATSENLHLSSSASPSSFLLKSSGIGFPNGSMKLSIGQVAHPGSPQKLDGKLIRGRGTGPSICLSPSKPPAISAEDGVSELKHINRSSSIVYLMRRADASQYVNASSLLVAGGIEDEKERGIVLSLERGRVRVKCSPEYQEGQLTLEGTWIPLSRARALAVTCALDTRLSFFLSEELPRTFPLLPLSTQNHELFKEISSHEEVSYLDRSSCGTRLRGLNHRTNEDSKEKESLSVLGWSKTKSSSRMPTLALMSPSFPTTLSQTKVFKRRRSISSSLGDSTRRPKVIGIPQPQSFFSEAHSRLMSKRQKNSKPTLEDSTPNESLLNQFKREVSPNDNADSDATESEDSDESSQTSDLFSESISDHTATEDENESYSEMEESEERIRSWSHSTTSTYRKKYSGTAYDESESRRKRDNLRIPMIHPRIFMRETKVEVVKQTSVKSSSYEAESRDTPCIDNSDRKMPLSRRPKSKINTFSRSNNSALIAPSRILRGGHKKQSVLINTDSTARKTSQGPPSPSAFDISRRSKSPISPFLSGDSTIGDEDEDTVLDVDGDAPEVPLRMLSSFEEDAVIDVLGDSDGTEEDIL